MTKKTRAENLALNREATRGEAKKADVQWRRWSGAAGGWQREGVVAREEGEKKSGRRVFMLGQGQCAELFHPDSSLCITDPNHFCNI